MGLRIASCALWAPACTTALFRQHYEPAIRDGRIDRFALFTLRDDIERADHCAHVYHKSLLYLVSRALEKDARNAAFPNGVPLLGLERCVGADPALFDLLTGARCDWIPSPNGLPEGDPNGSNAEHHGDFDDDPATVQATLARILGPPPARIHDFTFHRSASSRAENRQALPQ